MSREYIQLRTRQTYITTSSRGPLQPVQYTYILTAVRFMNVDIEATILRR